MASAKLFSLEGKVAIITGAASGMGLATAKLFLDLGASVYGVDISKGPTELASSPAFDFLQIDLRQKGAPERVVRECQQAFGGRVDALLNIAGVMDTSNSVDTLDEDQWNKIIAVNLTAPTMLSKHVVNACLAQGTGGTIVNISSKAGISGSVAGVAYTASKHGIIGLTKNVAFRFRYQKIRCNAICPGGFTTNITQSIDRTQIDQEATKLIEPVIKLHQEGYMDNAASPVHIASLCAYLVSDAGSEVNGAIIPVDNAWSCI
ncbi:uncharacterized protein Z518_11310 [Rhinocladiella mackenziei CBS 650.93]|uniref:Uncharacterized protein n=1 Tax=Rhinocladiella mackenziei CBS 650.93 TaxID=1442369 RepID=A0A0D2FBU8_9EURO|nr:uncharacterized protein Z518_11310 [Rhinocladiella mackenziei CBS 650.93]KIW99571.1 hypothetical protein Z518_11310 [Rhinocladiella mackenziei CBS 650.93]